MWYLRVLTVALHLVCVNLAAAAPIVSVWLDVRATRGRRLLREEWAEAVDRAACRLAYTAIMALQCGILLGLVSIAWLYLDGRTDFLRAAIRIKSRIWWGVAEVAFSLVCLLVYYGWYHYRRPAGVGWRAIHRLIAVMSATNLLYHFPPLFSILQELTTAADTQPVTSPEFRQLLLRPVVWAKTCHVWGASIAVTGMGLSLLANDRGGTDADLQADEELTAGHGEDIEPHSATLRRWGATWALGGSLLQVPTGLWLIGTLPRQDQFAVMGNDRVATCLLAASVLLTFWLLHQLASAALGELSARQAKRLTMAMGLIVLLMTATLLRISP